MKGQKFVMPMETKCSRMKAFPGVFCHPQQTFPTAMFELLLDQLQSEMNESRSEIPTAALGLIRSLSEIFRDSKSVSSSPHQSEGYQKLMRRKKQRAAKNEKSLIKTAEEVADYYGEKDIEDILRKIEGSKPPLKNKQSNKRKKKAASSISEAEEEFPEEDKEHQLSELVSTVEELDSHQNDVSEKIMKMSSTYTSSMGRFTLEQRENAEKIIQKEKELDKVNNEIKEHQEKLEKLQVKKNRLQNDSQRYEGLVEMIEKKKEGCQKDMELECEEVQNKILKMIEEIKILNEKIIETEDRSPLVDT